MKGSSYQSYSFLGVYTSVSSYVRNGEDLFALEAMILETNIYYCVFYMCSLDPPYTARDVCLGILNVVIWKIVSHQVDVDLLRVSTKLDISKIRSDEDHTISRVFLKLCKLEMSIKLTIPIMVFPYINIKFTLWFASNEMLFALVIKFVINQLV